MMFARAFYKWSKIDVSIVLLMALSVFAFADEPSATEECFKIGSAEELFTFSNYVNGTDLTEGHPWACGELTADITLNENVIVDDTLNVADASDFIRWNPIGAMDHPFSGTFKGHGHKIKGLFVISNYFPGFFGFVSGGTSKKPVTIDSLYIEDSYLNTSSKSASVGFISYSTDAIVSISNVTFSGLIISEHGYAGGLLGSTNDTDVDISYSANMGKIIAGMACGGFIGYVDLGNSSIKDSYNQGSIIGENAVGGFVGNGFGEIVFLNSYNKGVVTSGYYAGGFVGNILYSDITFLNSYNVGTVSSDIFAGGFISTRMYAYIIMRNVFNFGKIVSDFGYTDDIVNASNGLTAFNVFYNGSSSVKNAIHKDSSDFYNGDVAVRLHVYKDEYVDGSVWRQGKDDDYPKLSGDVDKIFLQVSNPIVLKNFEPEKDTAFEAYEFFDVDLLYPENRDDYVFDGWFETEGCAASRDSYCQSVDVLQASGQDELTYWARWIPIHKLNFVTNGGSFEVSPNSTTFLEGNTVALPTDISKDHSVFRGWFTSDGDDGKKLNAIADTVKTDITLYAKWLDIKTPELVDDCYQIGTAEELYGFAELVKKNATSCGKLTADIVVNEDVLVNGELNPDTNVVNQFMIWTPIGLNSDFSGSFDGNGHEIRGLYFVNQYGLAGLFANVSNENPDSPVQIKNVGIADSYFNGTNVGGIIASVKEYSKVLISQSYNKSYVYGSFYAGLVGLNKYGSELTIVNSYDVGMSNTSLYGGLANNSGKAVVVNSYVAGIKDSTIANSVVRNVNMMSLDYNGNVVSGQGTSVIVNSYSLGAKLENGFVISKNEFENGFVVDLLHNYKDSIVDGSVWGQAIGKDAYPVLNGVGKTIVAAEPNYVDGCYEITNAPELFWFSSFVNTSEYPDVMLCGKLKNDILVNVRIDGNDVVKWTPIGTAEHPFAGTFFGEFHKISGLFIDDAEASDIGLFGYVVGSYKMPAFVRDMGIENSYFSGKANVGSIAGVNDGVLSVENVYVLDSVKGSENVGSFVGYNKGEIIINNSYYWGPNVALYSGDDACSLNNVFYVGASLENGEVVTADDFKNGSVAVLLHDYDGTWGENVGVDSLPRYSGKIVFPVTLYGNGGFISEFSNIKNFSYDESLDLPGAEYVTSLYYDFAGWFESRACADKISKDGCVAVTKIAAKSTSAKKYYAAWTPKKYMVSFRDFYGRDVIEPKEYAYGTLASDVEYPDDLGGEEDARYVYTFLGWGVNGTVGLYDVYGDLVYYSIYQKSEKSTDKDLPLSSSSSSSVKSSSSFVKLSSSSVKSDRSSSSSNKNAIEQVVTMPQFSVSVAGRSLQIAGAKVGAVLTVFDMLGKDVFTSRVGAVNFAVDMPHAGTYLVRIDSQIRRVNVR